MHSHNNSTNDEIIAFTLKRYTINVYNKFLNRPTVLNNYPRLSTRKLLFRLLILKTPYNSIFTTEMPPKLEIYSFKPVPPFRATITLFM